MKIAVYTLCYNEEFILPFFIKHYSRYTDPSLITIYDNHSTDSSRQIAKDAGCRVLTFSSSNKFRDDIQQKIKNKCWKRQKNKADWVIIVDADEFIYHSDLLDFLTKAKAKKIHLCKATGYQMISKDFSCVDYSEQLYHTFKTGIHLVEYDKPCILDPTALKSTNFIVGNHEADPKLYNSSKAVNIDKDNLKLLHYSCFSWQYYWDKMQRRFARLSKWNLNNNWGIHYHGSEEEHRSIFDNWLQKAEIVI